MLTNLSTYRPKQLFFNIQFAEGEANEVSMWPSVYLLDCCQEALREGLLFLCKAQGFRFLSRVLQSHR